MYLTTGVYAWLILSSLIVIYDCSYVLLRPASMRGGSLFEHFSAYETYIKYDTLYGNMNDRLVVIQAWLTLVEVAVALFGMLLSAFGSKSGKFVGAMLVVIISGFTFWKTVIYCWYAYGFMTPESFDFSIDSIYSLYFPISLWSIFPVYTMWVVPRNILRALEEAPQKGKSKRQ